MVNTWECPKLLNFQIKQPPDFWWLNLTGLDTNFFWRLESEENWSGPLRHLNHVWRDLLFAEDFQSSKSLTTKPCCTLLRAKCEAKLPGVQMKYIPSYLPLTVSNVKVRRKQLNLRTDLYLPYCYLRLVTHLSRPGCLYMLIWANDGIIYTTTIEHWAKLSPSRARVF